jgi:hypothetical protein
MSKLPGSYLSRLREFRLLSWIALSAIVVVYLILVVRLHPANFFGSSQDDTLYFSSAKAIAEGQGYVLPSLPGTPPATKYPILYPWILSWVWRWNPSFPDNLSEAVALNVSFGVATILLVYHFLRSALGLEDWESCVITAFYALHPLTIVYSSCLMTDIPFSALFLAALLSAASAVRSPQKFRFIILAALFANLCILMRLAGVAICAGILLALLLKKYWRHATLFSAAILPSLCYFGYQTWIRVMSIPPAPFSPQLPGWTQTWFYYTSYAAFRKLDSPSLGAAITQLLNQFLYLVFAISGYFFSPWSEHHVVFWFVTALPVWLALAGGARKAFGRSECLPALFALLGYAGLLMTWDYPEWPRFLLPFFPLVLGLMWLQARNWISWMLRSLSSAQTSDRIAACGAAVCLLVLLVIAVWNYGEVGRNGAAETSAKRRAKLSEKLQAYEWIGKYIPPDGRIIAAEDGLSFLYTGRQAINFTVLMPVGIYDRRRLSTDLHHMADVPRAINASYWVITNEDSKTQLSGFNEPLATRLAEVERALPKAFQSSGGAVRIYDLACLHRPTDPTCSSIINAIFPSAEMQPAPLPVKR